MSSRNSRRSLGAPLTSSSRLSMGGSGIPRDRESVGSSQASREEREPPVDNNDSIKVICRFRPTRELKKGESMRAEVRGVERIDSFSLDSQTGEVQFIQDTSDGKTFKFDKVFGTATKQTELFDEVSSTVNSVMAGFNGTIMAYGQTSAGKSFSMEGLSLWDPSSQGIIPRCVDRLFDEINQADADNQFQVVLSFYEIYCEKVRDLLNPSQTNLKVRETKQSGFIVQDITEIFCTDRESVLRVIELGKTNRASAPTLMNAESSRSHSIVSILVDQKNATSGRQKKGTLYLVDLAGSEKVSKTGASGMRLEEAKNINGSLTTLGMVINALCDGNGHVPYRDSKLTMILSDALGGNSKTTLVICCNPEQKHSPETLSTLRFGERAKKIKCHAKVNEEYSVEELKQMLTAAKKEIALLKSKLKKGGISNTSTMDLMAGIDEIISEPSSPFRDLTRENTVSLEQSQQEKEMLLDEISSLKGKIMSLEEELETERLKFKEEHEEHVMAQTESEALKSTIQDLEEKLLKASLNSKQSTHTMKTANSFADHGDEEHVHPFNMNEVDGEHHHDQHQHHHPEEDVEPDDEYRYQQERLDAMNREHAAVANPEFTMTQLSAQSAVLNTKLEAEINVLARSINEHEIETRSAQQSAQTFADKYVKLREEYELHVQRLMLKLTQEQQARTTVEEKLEEAYHKLWHQSGGKSNSRNQRNSIFSWFGQSGSSSMAGTPGSVGTRPSTRTPDNRENNISRSLELAQFRISQLVAELEATKEAQQIVLETKESVMRSLARQNSTLTIERDSLNKRVDEMTHTVEQLTTLLRSIQSRKDIAPSPSNNGRMARVIKGGTITPKADGGSRLDFENAHHATATTATTAVSAPAGVAETNTREQHNTSMRGFLHTTSSNNLRANLEENTFPPAPPAASAADNTL